ATSATGSPRWPRTTSGRGTRPGRSSTTTGSSGPRCRTASGSGELWSVEASGANDIGASGDLLAATRAPLVEHAPSAFSGAVVGSTHVSGATVSWFGPES